MRELLALLGAIFFFGLALDEFPDVVSKLILGSLWLVIAIKLVAFAAGVDLSP